MPVQRVSQSFKDISATFQINPLNRDLIALNNSYAIARSIRNLIMTVPGDRPFNPVLGSQVTNLVFENLDKVFQTILKAATYELMYKPNVSLNIIIKEYLNSSNFFLEDSQTKYLNALLDNLGKKLRFINA